MIVTDQIAGRSKGLIRVGIGGWTYEPWRGVFYPRGLPHARELAYASRELTTIEINATFDRTQRPATFASWAAETPEDFVFSLKAPRAATNRRVLADATPSIERFVESGIVELGARLGPILWQFPPTKTFDEVDVGHFLEKLPARAADLSLRHAIEVRHPSFAVPAFVALARRFGAAIVYAEHATYPAIADPTADFTYVRLQKGRERLQTGYTARELDAWCRRLRTWATGDTPTDLPVLAPARGGQHNRPRTVFAYVIHDAKVRAPAAARALIERLAK